MAVSNIHTRSSDPTLGFLRLTESTSTTVLQNANPEQIFAVNGNLQRIEPRLASNHTTEDRSSSIEFSVDIVGNASEIELYEFTNSVHKFVSKQVTQSEY